MSGAAYDKSSKARRPSRLIEVIICLPHGAGTDEEQTEFNVGRQAGIPIGFVNLHGVNEATRHHRTLDIGMLITPEFRGKGYGTEAVHWILNWGFQSAGLHRIGLASASFNTGAIRPRKRFGIPQGWQGSRSRVEQRRVA